MNALNLKTRITVKPAPWWPASLRERVRRDGNVLWPVRWSKAERRGLRKRKPIKPSVWAERYRVLSEVVSVRSGPWRNDVTPYLVDIMDAAALPFIEEIDICKVPQSGATEAVHNFVGWACDYAPGPVMYVFPDELMAKENSEERVQPMFQSSRRLHEFLTGKQDDEARLNIKLRHMRISFAWSSSASRLGNKPVRYGIGDEFDKWAQPVSGRGSKDTDKKAHEPTAKALLDKRMNTYRSLGLNKVFIFSSPAREKGGVWELVETAPARFDRWVRCPLCGHLQLMHWGGKDSKGGYRLPADCRDPERIYAENLAWYECAGCGGRWDDFTKNRAAAAGCWIERTSGLEIMEHLNLHKPRRIGFHLPAWVVPFISIGETAKAFLTDLKDFTTQYEARPWIDRVVHSEVENILKAVTPLPPQTVPQEAVALTFFADNQKHSKWFMVRAFGRDQTSWLVHKGQVFTFDELTEILQNAHYPVEGEGLKGLWRCAIDTGGGGKYEDMSMTEECYEWIGHMRRQGVRVVPCKGASRPIPGSIVKIGNPLQQMPSGKPMPFSMRIYSLDTAKLKDLFFTRLAKACKGEPAGAYLHVGDEEYYRDYTRHLRAERKVEDAEGNIAWQQMSSENHLLDCEVGCLALAHPLWPGGGVNLLRPAVAAEKKEEVSDNPFTGGKKLFGGNR